MKRTLLFPERLFPKRQKCRAISVHKTSLTIYLCLCLSLLFVSAAAAQEPLTYTVFEAPDAGTAPFEGTLALTINTSGTAAGYYYDSGDVAHGFVRATSGAITRVQRYGHGR